MLEKAEALTADGFDKAIIGITTGLGEQRAVYDYDKCVCILTDKGWSPTEAIEHMEYNVVNSYVGERTPIFILT